MSDRVRLGVHFLLVAVLTSTIGTVPTFAADPSGASTAAPAEATASGPAPDVAPGPAEPSQPAGNGEPVIVLLRDRADVDTAVARARVGTPFRVSHVFRHALKGYAATLTPAQRAFVAHDPAVEAIVPDSPVQLEAQSIPWGVRRVGAVASPATKINGIDGSGQRINSDVAIIDTGIQRNHPDLNVVGGVNCADDGRPASYWDDVQGHGTHVAGIVGAKDNGSGVVGAAPGVRLWSVRTFLSNGFSRISWIVCGIDWVTSLKDPADHSKPRIEVVNMSLRDEGTDDHGCGFNVPDAEHRAICRSVAAGTTYVVAAGNDRTTASKWRPASYDEVITVSAIADFDGKAGGLAAAPCASFGTRNRDDRFASFSNFGGDVDITAPGACVRSTYWGSRYATISGTSMASPHVAGAAAVYKALHPTAAPTEVRQALIAMASYNWFTSTDPDGSVDPLLDMRSLGATPDFGLHLLTAPVPVWAGVRGHDATSVRLQTIRGNGFAGTVALTVDGLPSDVTASWDRSQLVGLTGRFATLTLRAGLGAPAGTYTVVIHGASGTLQHAASFSVVVRADTTAPAIQRPRPIRIPLQTLESPTVAVTVGWPTTETGTGLATMAARERVDDGAYADLTLNPALATAITRRQRFGSTYTYAITATDRAGNTASTTGSDVPHGVSELHATYTGRWTTYAYPYAWGGKARYSTAAGASASFRFTGKTVGLVVPEGPGRGQVRVYADGRFVSTVDLYAATPGSRHVLFSRSWATAGTHTLKLVVVGTSHRPRVDVDGFIVFT